MVVIMGCLLQVCMLCRLNIHTFKMVDVPSVSYSKCPFCQDIEVGKAVRPQLAARVSNVEEAWKKVWTWHAPCC